VKRRVACVFLLLFAAWPALQHTLVRVYDVDPWRLCGWAMYSVPGSMKTLRVVALRDGAEPQLLNHEVYPPEVERLVTTYRWRKQALGELASADRLAETLLAMHTDWDGVALPMVTLALDPESARTHVVLATTTVWRDGRNDTWEAPLSLFMERGVRPGRASGPVAPDRNPRTR